MSLLRYCFPTFVRLAEWVAAHFTRGGLAILVAMLACIPVVIYAETPLFHIFSAFFSLLVVTGTLGWLLRPRLQVQAKAARAVHREQPLKMELTLNNPTWAPAFDMEVSLKASDALLWNIPRETMYVPHLGIRQVTNLTLIATPLRRGVWTLPELQIVSTFPLNLFYQCRSIKIPGELVVYPHYDPGCIDQLLSGHDAGEALEWESPSLSAGATIYSGNREYVPGMYVRRWDYSSWARTGKPIVREITDPPQSTACVLMDTTLDPHPTQEQSLAFEAALSVTAGLVDRLLCEDWSIDLFRVGPTQLNSSARTQSVSLDAMLETLARAQGTSEDAFEAWKKFVESSDPHAVVYLIFTHWDERRTKLCRQLISEQFVWRAFLLSDQPLALPVDLIHFLHLVSPRTVNN
jgi:uncharacterized protein (DUF58 family)